MRRRAIELDASQVETFMRTMCRLSFAAARGLHAEEPFLSDMGNSASGERARPDGHAHAPRHFGRGHVVVRYVSKRYRPTGAGVL
jgi:hypothetical protein